MTLRPTRALVVTPTFCIFCGTVGGVDFVLNMVLFVPLGMALRWASGRWMTAVIIGAVATLVIETLQWRLVTGRDASLGDLLANTLGTMLGAWIAAEVFRWLNANSRSARGYAGAFGILASAVLCASAWLLQPVRPRDLLWVHWTPSLLNTEPFQGRLLAVELNDRPIHPFQVLPARHALDSLSRSQKVRAIIVLPAPATGRQAVIVRIANPLELGFSIVQWGEAVAFRTQIAAVRLKLRPILVGLEDAFVVSGAAAELTVEANSSPRAIVLSRQHASGAKSIALQRTVGLAWALFTPWDIALSPRWWMANAFWLGALVLPVSFFTVRSAGAANGGTARRIAWWPLPLVLATLAALPITGLGTLAVGEWFGVLAGIAAGLLLERATANWAGTDLKGSAPNGTILP